MDPMISVPREKLADLLRAAGSTLTPEEFALELPSLHAFRKYPSRAWAAAMSKYGILVVAVAGVILLPVLGFTIENILIVVGLVTVTYFEYRVHRYFRENDPRGPGLGFRNQACFAAGITVYCLYHAFTSLPSQDVNIINSMFKSILALKLSQDDMNLYEDNNLMSADGLQSIMRTLYLFLAVIVGGSQYALAWYYRTAAPKD